MDETLSKGLERNERRNFKKHDIILECKWRNENRKKNWWRNPGNKKEAGKTVKWRKHSDNLRQLFKEFIEIIKQEK